jgi:hypothetical protein
MADIKQAAKWIGEGQKVRRQCWTTGSYLKKRRGPSIEFTWQTVDRYQRVSNLNCEDLLADDWEIAE